MVDVPARSVTRRVRERRGSRRVSGGVEEERKERATRSSSFRADVDATRKPGGADAGAGGSGGGTSGHAWDVHLEHLNAEGAPQAAHAAYPARILGASRVPVFGSTAGCADSRSLPARRVSTRRPFPHDVSGHARDAYPRAGVRDGSRRASREVTGFARRGRRHDIIVHRETRQIIIDVSRKPEERGERFTVRGRGENRVLRKARVVTNATGGARRETTLLTLSRKRHTRETTFPSRLVRARPIPTDVSYGRSSFSSRRAPRTRDSRLRVDDGHLDLDTGLDGDGGDLLDDVRGEWRSIRRLWMRSWKRSQVLVPSPRGDLRTVRRRVLVGMRTGPFTLRRFSLAPRIGIRAHLLEVGHVLGGERDANAVHALLDSLFFAGAGRLGEQTA